MAGLLMAFGGGGLNWENIPDREWAVLLSLVYQKWKSGASGLILETMWKSDGSGLILETTWKSDGSGLLLETTWKSNVSALLLETTWPQSMDLEHSTGPAGGNVMLCFPGPCDTVAVE